MGEDNPDLILGSWYFLSDNSIANFFDFEFYFSEINKTYGSIITYFPALGRWAWSTQELLDQAFCFVCQNGESLPLFKKPPPA